MTNITDTEFNFLRQQLDFELRMISKYKKYANDVTDAQLKQKLEEIASNHEQHYIKILNQI